MVAFPDARPLCRPADGKLAVLTALDVLQHPRTGEQMPEVVPVVPAAPHRVESL
jgi:hypothetical protein